MCLYLRATCFGLDIDYHRVERVVIKMYVKAEIYKNNHFICKIPYFYNILFYNEIVKLRMVDGN